MTIWGSNTSPLIFLANLERLELLRKMAPNLLIPNFVLMEIKTKEDIASERIQEACKDWITVETVQNRHAVSIAMADLQQGEAEAIVLAQEKKAERLLIDDQDARRFASRCRLKIVGTLGLLLAAKKRGLISVIRPEIDRLIAMGFRIKPQLKESILSEAGEE